MELIENYVKGGGKEGLTKSRGGAKLITAHFMQILKYYNETLLYN
jgi:hypothetical protein